MSYIRQGTKTDMTVDTTLAHGMTEKILKYTLTMIMEVTIIEQVSS